MRVTSSMASTSHVYLSRWSIWWFEARHLIFDLMEPLSHFLPAATVLRLDSLDFYQAQAEITLTLTSWQTATHCPLCRLPARRVHSRYRRTLADLPWGSYTVRLWLRVR